MHHGSRTEDNNRGVASRARQPPCVPRCSSEGESQPSKNSTIEHTVHVRARTLAAAATALVALLLKPVMATVATPERITRMMPNDRTVCSLEKFEHECVPSLLESKYVQKEFLVAAQQRDTSRRDTCEWHHFNATKGGDTRCPSG